MESIQEQKTVLRREINSKRRALSLEQWALLSEKIRRRIIESPFYASAEILLTYVSSKDNEVDTHTLIDCALAEGKQILVPVLANERGGLRWSRLTSRDQLIRGRFGLCEVQPEFIEEVRYPDKGSICITPGIAFSKTGYRLGYGGGYYDRFLGEYQGITIGLAFEFQVVDAVPVDTHDFRVHHVVTDSFWYVCPPEER